MKKATYPSDLTYAVEQRLEQCKQALQVYDASLDAANDIPNFDVDTNPAHAAAEQSMVVLLRVIKRWRTMAPAEVTQPK